MLACPVEATLSDIKIKPLVSQPPAVAAAAWTRADGHGGDIGQRSGAGSAGVLAGPGHDRPWLEPC